MEDVFKPQSLTIKQLFGNPDSLYQIPRYQRPYSWGDDEVQKLWDDLLDAQLNEPNYFLGSIITAKPDGPNSPYLDIVDGQQRLTTLMILLAVYRDLYPDINQDILDDDPFAIDGNIIKTSIKYNDRFERLRLKTHSNHESDFQEIILADGASIKNEFPLKKDLKKQEDPHFKFKNTAAFFFEKLSRMGPDLAGQLINYLFNKVKIIRIDCQDVSFAIKLFQVLNDRGLDLSNSDLIKSFLIGQIHTKFKGNDFAKKQHEDRFMDDWKFCENIAIDTEESLNDLFVMYEYYLLAENPSSSLYDQLVKKFKEQDANHTIADFKKFVTCYKDRVYYREDSIMYGFWYLRWTMYWKSIVLTALHSKYPSYEKFLSIFRRYYYISWIAGDTMTRVKQTSFNIIKWLKMGRPITEIESELEASLSESNNNAMGRAINNLNSDIYNEPWCKPLLFLIEYNQQDNPPFYFVGDNALHVEHILPRSFRKTNDWSHLHHDVGLTDEWVNSGANLTLLSGQKNIAASNRGFADKLQSYDGTGNHLKDDKKVTSFTITQKIVNDAAAGLYGGKWNIDSIEARWKWFCDEVMKVLRIDLSSIKNQNINIPIPEEN